MRILLHPEISRDLSLCRKKKWYNGLEEELDGIYRLLTIDKCLPGQSPMKSMGSEWVNKVLHARILLPKENLGGRKGARIVYVFDEDRCRVLYVGGHRDKRYDDSRSVTAMILERLKEPAYLEWIEN